MILSPDRQGPRRRGGPATHSPMFQRCLAWDHCNRRANIPPGDGGQNEPPRRGPETAADALLAPQGPRCSEERR